MYPGPDSKKVSLFPIFMSLHETLPRPMKVFVPFLLHPLLYDPFRRTQCIRDTFESSIKCIFHKDLTFLPGHIVRIPTTPYL